ncbi:MAG TPA: CRISPR-associated protein Cas4 [Clostridiales bacterium]|nr:CRISPR-associated protein Cas4 [Clostridiales bacterium]
MLTGTIINYFFHCKRQCWLFYNKINLEDNSEDVRIGRILHELKNDGKNEISFENIKLDKITSEYVIEIKKSDADIKAATAQLEFYLMLLLEKGIIRKGRLEVIEKNKQNKKMHYIVLDNIRQEELKAKYKEIEEFLESLIPPQAIYTSKCKRCAYYEYCFI